MYCKKCKDVYVKFRCNICQTEILGECYEHHNERCHRGTLILLAERDAYEKAQVIAFDYHQTLGVKQPGIAFGD